MYSTIPNQSIRVRNFLQSLYLSSAIRDCLTRGNSLYKKALVEHEKARLRASLRSQLRTMAERYRDEVSDPIHIQHIRSLADHLTGIHGEILEAGKFPFGRAQKALNVYLKYRWCDDAAIRPPHCPFDEIIIGELALAKGISRSWTKMDSEDAYQAWVAAARKLANGESLPEWELRVYETATSKGTARAQALQFERLSREPKGNSRGWKFSREEIQRQIR
jgi:hypothetical protein